MDWGIELKYERLLLQYREQGGQSNRKLESLMPSKSYEIAHFAQRNHQELTRR
jgi:hypothetical protein